MALGVAQERKKRGRRLNSGVYETGGIDEAERRCCVDEGVAGRPLGRCSRRMNEKVVDGACGGLLDEKLARGERKARSGAGRLVDIACSVT